MSDHVARRPRRAGSRKSVGVRELKTHAARILRQVREARASYLLTHRGRAIGVILPVDGEDEVPDALEAVDATAAWDAFLRTGRRLERRFAPGAGGVGLLSDMRR
jgi:antitoxin (DNA-binding transcriptional repressor) of toxin-antitoxin stability system